LGLFGAFWGFLRFLGAFWGFLGFLGDQDLTLLALLAAWQRCTQETHWQLQRRRWGARKLADVGRSSGKSPEGHGLAGKIMDQPVEKTGILSGKLSQFALENGDL